MNETPCPLCFAVFFTLGILINLPSKGQMVITSTKTAYACSNPSTGACIVFNLSCNTDQRIQILDAKYSLSSYSGLSNSSVTCADESKHQCFTEGKLCCKGQNHTLYKYEPGHRYSLYKRCSWQPTCTEQAIYQTTKGVSDYCVITYQCSQETNVTFCDASAMNGSNINIIYNHQNITVGNVTCWCVVNSKGDYNIKAQDFRLLDDNENCIDSVNLKVNNSTISCSQTEQLIDMEVNKSGYSEFKITLQANQTPQMIWIKVEALNQESIEAECFSKDKPPPEISTQSPVSSSTVTVNDYGSVSSTTLKPTKVTSTPVTSSTVTVNDYWSVSSTTLKSSNVTSTTFSETPVITTKSDTSNIVNGTTDDVTISTEDPQEPGSTADGQAVHAPSSGEVSTAAIVTPVVLLVIIGTAVAIVAIMFWRKRRKMNDKLDGTGDNNYDKPEKKPSEEQRNNYDNCVPPTTLMKTSENYIILESEGNYNYIDHEDAQKSGSYQEMSNSSVSAAPKQEPDVSNYSAFGFRDSNAPDNDGNNTKDAKSGEMEVGNPNYFVLEASGPSVVGQKENLSALEQRSERIDVEITPNSSNGESPSYFTLEPLNASGEPNKISRADHVASQKVDTTANNYFVLEPQDTYSSIDPKDVIVQTLPDDEYNVLNIKSQGTGKGLNYTELKSHHVDNKAQEFEDYSHIGSSAVGNKDRLQEYSHINFDNAHVASNEASGNEYSHLGSVVTTQSAEGSDYAHLQKKLP